MIQQTTAITRLTICIIGLKTLSCRAKKPTSCMFITTRSNFIEGCFMSKISCFSMQKPRIKKYISWGSKYYCYTVHCFHLGVLILQSLKDPHGPKKHSISNIHGFSGFPVTSSIQGLNVVKFKKQAFQLEASTAAKLAKQQMFLQHANPVSLIPKPRQVPYPAQRLVLIPLKVCKKL